MPHSRNRVKQPLQQIPTNIITGFLGVGKTTTIGALLAQKPVTERWAVLVNEFGKIGLDGDLLATDNRDNPSIFVQEVAGGCLCCVASVPFQVALNQLLKQARPDHLLIEPTGLGHPRQILDALSRPEYNTIIDLRATITLVDARKITDDRYRNHPTFQQQLEVADLLVAHKSDCYQSDELEQLRHYLSELGRDETPLLPASQGAIPLQWLDLPHFAITDQPPPLPTNDPLKSCGWIYDTGTCFDLDRLEAIIEKIDPIRLKAILQTEQGSFIFNRVDGEMNRLPLELNCSSRIELIVPEDIACNNVEQLFLSTQRTE